MPAAGIPNAFEMLSEAAGIQWCWQCFHVAASTANGSAMSQPGRQWMIHHMAVIQCRQRATAQLSAMLVDVEWQADAASCHCSGVALTSILNA